MQEPRALERFRDLSLGDFVDRLQSAEPVPGGGSASAVAASLGGALLAMVASLSTGRPKYTAYAATLNRAMVQGPRLSERLLALADEDSDAYGQYASALKMPRGTEDEQEVRRQSIRAAAGRAAEVPLSTMEVCLEVARQAEALAGRSNVNAASDVGVAALLAEAGARGAAANVLINLPSIGDEARAAAMGERVNELLREVEQLAADARRLAQSGDQREPEAS